MYISQTFRPYPSPPQELNCFHSGFAQTPSKPPHPRGSTAEEHVLAHEAVVTINIKMGFLAMIFGKSAGRF